MRKLGRPRAALRLDDVDIADQLSLAIGHYGAHAPWPTLDAMLDLWGAVRAEWHAQGRPAMFLFMPHQGEAEPAVERLWRQHRGR